MRTQIKSGIASLLALTLFISTFFCGIITLNVSAYDPITVVANDTGDIIEFGSYPKSLVTDTALQGTLNSLSNSEGTWISYNYYSGNVSSYSDYWTGKMVASAYFQYKDLEFEGVKYRGVLFTKYRPGMTDATEDWNQQQGNGYTKNTTYWFKYEPLQWIVLDSESGLVIAKDVIDAVSFNNYVTSVAYSISDSYYYGDAEKTYYANIYETSSVREWLNNDFIATAFSEDEKSNIQLTELSDDVYDKVFILTAEDVCNTEYGFTSNSDRIATGTDYALCQGLADEGASYWWTRDVSGANDYLSCKIVASSGSFDNQPVNETEIGVRPAFCFTECMHVSTELRDVKDATCGEQGYSGDEYCKICGKLVKKGSATETTEHNWEEFEGKAVTCYEDGWDAYKVCKDCGYSTKTIIKSNGHDLQVIAGKAPTCTSIGWEQYFVCKKCDFTTYKELAMVDHDIEILPAQTMTCTQDGKTEGSRCKSCGKVFAEQIVTKAPGHVDEDSNGYCDTCGEQFEITGYTMLDFLIRFFTILFTFLKNLKV